MAVWLIRAGKHGEDEPLALEKGVSIIGWHEMPDISKISSKEEMKKKLAEVYPDMPPKAIPSNAAQLWAFVKRIQIGDIAVLPLKTRSAIALGKIISDYKYANGRHTRPVKWIREDIPREVFGQDLLYSFGAFRTVCQISRNNADQRINAILEGKEDPVVPDADEESVGADEATSIPDIEQYANEQIRQYISRKFKSHELARLVAQVLRAEGYQTEISGPGPDGGVDILAGRGPMGFDRPRICVQVKSGSSPVDVKVFRELLGVMDNRRAEQGLLVSWSGFTRSAVEESRRQFFRIRLWDGGAVVENILENYDKLSEELRAELSLKRVWVLAMEDK